MWGAISCDTGGAGKGTLHPKEITTVVLDYETFCTTSKTDPTLGGRCHEYPAMVTIRCGGFILCVTRCGEQVVYPAAEEFTTVFFDYKLFRLSQTGPSQGR